jgi:acetoin utilization protein AcuB
MATVDEGGSEVGACRGAAVGTAKQWMTRDPVSVRPEVSAAEVASIMRTNQIRHVLVVEDEQLVGIVSERDVHAVTFGGEPSLSPRIPVRRVMSEPPVSVSAETPLTDAARAMLEQKIGALPVLEQGRLVGILTKADALEALLDWIERGNRP